LHWLHHNAKRDNYLLHINYWDVHRCYKMEASWADRFATYPVPQDWPDEEAIRAHQAVDGPFTARRQFKDNMSPYPLMPGTVTSRRDFEHMVTGYDAAIAYVDHHVQIVLDELDRQNALSDSVIIISADHGDAFGEHGIYSDHVCADECIHRVPLIIRWPGKCVPGSTCDAYLYNIDLAPTLCQLLDIQVPDGWDGVSFRGCVEGNHSAGREYLVWGHGLYAVQRAVRLPQYLLIRTYDDYGYGFAPVELYDIESDPYQTNDLASGLPVVVHECDHLMAEWVREQLAKDGWPTDPLFDVLRERQLPG
jgi:choline-sulfatase